MTSLERRREARYQRRKAKREKKRQERLAEYDSFDNVIAFANLYRANKLCKKGVLWKRSTLSYQIRLLSRLFDTHQKLQKNKYKTKGFSEFLIVERGKPRPIKSVHYSERIVQRSVCDNALVPILSNSLIYDNGACLPGKGVDGTLDRMEHFLHRYYRKNNFSNHGYVVTCDFSNYFGSIRHEEVYKLYKRHIKDKRLLQLLKSFIHPFGYQFDQKLTRKPQMNNLKGEYIPIGLGLGSQISQVTAVSLPNSIDHYVKEVLRVKPYIRYMDDSIAIFQTKEEAQAYLKIYMQLCEDIGIIINKKKTQIHKLERGFTFLKVKFTLTPTGKVIRKVSKKNVVRERRKLKKLHKKVLRGELTVEDIRRNYASWKGYALQRNGYCAVRKMDKLYYDLFREIPPFVHINKSKKKKWRH